MRRALAVILLATGCSTATPAPATAPVSVPLNIHVATRPTQAATAADVVTLTPFGVTTVSSQDGVWKVFVAGDTDTLARLKVSGWPWAHTHDRVTTISSSKGVPPTGGDVSPAPSLGDRNERGRGSYYTDRRVIAFPKARNSRGCAHKTLPAGTRVTVTAGGRSTWCVVDDRGPYIAGRIIDLQAAQFDDLAPLSAGVVSVTISWSRP